MAESTGIRHDLDAFKSSAQTAKMFMALEDAIREANTFAIGAATGGIGKEEMIRVAAAVSRFRASYLVAVVRLGKLSGHEMPSEEMLAELRRLRQAYEEGLEGFGALRHALERGYFQLNDETSPARPKAKA